MEGEGAEYIYIYRERDLIAPDFAVMMYIYIYIHTCIREICMRIHPTSLQLDLHIYIYIRTYTLYIICVEAQNMYDSLLVPDTHTGSSKGR